MNSSPPSHMPGNRAEHAGLAWQLAEMARSNQSNCRLAVWICPDVRSYRQLVEELAFFLQDSPDLLWRFPSWEVLPYDRV
ncbi:MAG TPA: hypothetical protein VKA31_08245, partial [Mariprofundaceae bacterium]|nr:hypothetical protein [Mariprofundaceae bacterium]